MHVPELVEIPQLAELMQTQLKEIGINVTLNVESTDTFYDRWCKVYDSTNEPAGCDGGEEFGIVDYGNRGTPDVYLVKAYATGEWNSAHYVSETFRAAVKEYQAALDLDDRKAAIKRDPGHRPRGRAVRDPVLLRLAVRLQEGRHRHRRHGPRPLLPRSRRLHRVTTAGRSRPHLTALWRHRTVAPQPFLSITRHRSPPGGRSPARGHMRRFILQRLLSIVVTLWLLATIVFLLVNVLPGNVGRQILGPFAPSGGGRRGSTSGSAPTPAHHPVRRLDQTCSRSTSATRTRAASR
jgi:hypothetical protein